MKEEFSFDDDKLYRLTPFLECGPDYYKKELVLTKEVFIKCYNKWIKEQKDE